MYYFLSEINQIAHRSRILVLYSINAVYVSFKGYKYLCCPPFSYDFKTFCFQYEIVLKKISILTPIQTQLFIR